MMKSSVEGSAAVSPSAFGHIKKRRKRSQHLHGVLQMDIDLIKNLDTQHLLTSLYNPTFKPLLVPPRKWHARESVTSRRGRVVGGPSDGGYLLLRSQFMRTHGSKLQSELLTRAKLDRVYDALNVCSGRAWYSSVVFECEAREYLFSDSLTHSTHSYDIHNPQLSSLSLSYPSNVTTRILRNT